MLQRLLRCQVLPAPVAEVLAAFKVAPASGNVTDIRDDEFIKLNMFNCSPEEDKVGIFFADHFLAHGVADIWKNQQTWGDC